MNAKIGIVVVFLIAIGAIIFVTRGSKTDPGPGTTAQPAPKPDEPKARVKITFVNSTEKKEWVEAALVEFSKANPDVEVEVIGKGSLQAAQEILDGKLQPTLWSPADTLVLRLLESDWQTKNGAAIFATSGDDAPQPLVITPLVFAVWQDRADVLLKASGDAITWKAIQKAVSSNQGWPAIGGKPTWGFVKLGHTDPTKSNSGLQTLLLMTLEYYGKNSGLTVDDLLDPKYQEFVKSIEKGVTRFETSTGTFMTDMVRFGPSKYDIAVVYENLAIAQLENAQGRWEPLRIYYPPVTLWSDHPIALLQTDWVTAPQKDAARRFVAFLRSRPSQERALRFGFRPADPAVPIKTADASNPFTRLAQYGVKIEIPPVADAPDGVVVRNLLMMWSRVVGR